VGETSVKAPVVPQTVTRSRRPLSPPLTVCQTVTRLRRPLSPPLTVCQTVTRSR